MNLFRRTLLCASTLLCGTAMHSLAFAYELQGNGWTFTSAGSSPIGEPATLTWSIVPNGTPLPTSRDEPNNPSSLISFLDNIHHPTQNPLPGGTDLTQRAWFPLIESAFARWDAVSGLRFSYSPQDDGAALGSGAPGVSGLRGDLRLSGHPIDGSGTILAYNFYPHTGDMVLDTNDGSRFRSTTNNFRTFRNTLMHEIGHGIGIRHVESNTHRFLLEPTLSTQFDGPQFDDILGAHRLYGDRYEELGGNDTRSRATYLGSLAKDQTITIGEDAFDAVIAATDVDFVSINKSADVDYHRFNAAIAGELSVLLSPLGFIYNEGPQDGTQASFNAQAQSDLALFLYDSTGINLLASSTSAGLGFSESILGFPLAQAGDYLLQITGTQDAAQFYQLDITLVPEPATLQLAAAFILLPVVGRLRRP